MFLGMVTNVYECMYLLNTYINPLTPLSTCSYKCMCLVAYTYGPGQQCAKYVGW